MQDAIERVAVDRRRHRPGPDKQQVFANVQITCRGRFFTCTPDTERVVSGAQKDRAQVDIAVGCDDRFTQGSESVAAVDGVAQRVHNQRRRRGRGGTEFRRIAGGQICSGRRDTGPGGDIGREGINKLRIPVPVGDDVPIAEIHRRAARFGEELDAECGVGRAVERTGDGHRVGGVGECTGEDGEVLPVVGPRVAVHVGGRVVGRDAVAFEVDAVAAIGVDDVAENAVVDSRGVLQLDPVPRVEGDHIAGAGLGAADQVAGLGCNANAVGAVADCRRTVAADADVVALNDRARRSRPRACAVADDDAVVVVAADHIAGSGCRPADHRAVRAALQLDAPVRVADVHQSCDVGADVVAEDPCADGVLDVDAVGVVADDVARGCGCAADRVRTSPAEDVHPAAAVPQLGGPGHVQADDVALDNVAGGRRFAVAVNDDAVRGVAGDDVALASPCSADFGSADAVVNHDAMASVGDGGRAVEVGPDVVAVDQIVVGPDVVDLDPVGVRPGVAGQHVSLAEGSVAADLVAVRAAGDGDAVARVPDRCRAGRVRADVVALDDVSGRGVAEQDDAVVGIARDDVAVGRGGTTNLVSSREVDLDPFAAVAEVHRAGRIDSDIIGDERVAAGICQQDSGIGETIDDQATNRAAVAPHAQGESAGRPGADPVEFDDWGPREVGVGRAVDHHGVGDCGEGRLHVDRVHAPSGDVERDRIEPTQCIRLVDRPAECADGAIVQRARDRECIQQPLPVGDDGVAEGNAGLHSAEGKFQVPVGLVVGVSRVVGAGGDVCAGSGCNLAQQRPSRCCGGEIAAVEQEVGLGIECEGPGLDQRAVLLERGRIKPCPTEFDGPIGPVGDEVHRVESVGRVAGESFGNLLDPVEIRIQDDVLERPSRVVVEIEVRQQLIEVLDIGVEEDKFAGLLLRFVGCGLCCRYVRKEIGGGCPAVRIGLLGFIGRGWLGDLHGCGGRRAQHQSLLESIEVDSARTFSAAADARGVNHLRGPVDRPPCDSQESPYYQAAPLCN